VRSAIREIDPTLPLLSVQTLAARSIRISRSNACSLFFHRASAYCRLLLAAVGQYGVIAYWVSERTREIGIRMALGARRGQVVWMVLRSHGNHVRRRVAVGLASAAAMGKSIQTLLFGITPKR